MTEEEMSLEDLAKKKKEFIKELENAFDYADVDDTIWYDDMTTLLEEIVIRFEKIFGKVDEDDQRKSEKPLDLEEIARNIFDIFDDEEFDLTVSNIKSSVKKHIKSACEFYLRYKDNPLLLWKENPKYRKELKKRFGINESWFDELDVNKIKTLSELYKQFQRIPKIDDSLYNQDDYNSWLFRLAFKEVLRKKEVKS